MTALDPDAYYERLLCRYEREVDRASEYWDWREGVLEEGGWDPSDDAYVTWLESIAP